MQKYELIVSDLDGTLLNSAMELSEKNRDAIKNLSDAGINFVASSGRTFYEVPESIRENPNIRYVIYSNGTAIYDKALGRDVLANRISKAAVNEALDILSDYDTVYWTHAAGRSVMDKSYGTLDYSHFQINDYYKTLLTRSKEVGEIERFSRESDEVEALVIFFGSDEELEKCRARLQKISGITVTSSIGHNIELCSEKAGKGAALAELAKMLKIPKEKIIAVGDNLNDTSMFLESGLSLCVENGNDEAKSIADRVICSNDDGVADYIINYVIK